MPAKVAVQRQALDGGVGQPLSSKWRRGWSVGRGGGCECRRLSVGWQAMMNLKKEGKEGEEEEKVGLGGEKGERRRRKWLTGQWAG